MLTLLVTCAFHTGGYHDKEEMLHDLRRSQQALESLMVVTMTTDVKSHSFIRSEIRMLRGRYFFLDMSHGGPVDSWETDYDRHRTFIRDGVYTTEFPARRLYETMPLESIDPPERFRLQPIWFALGWWADDAVLPCPSIDGVPVRIETALLDENYHIVGERNRFELGPCIVLAREGRDEIGLDPRRNWALRYRIVRAGVGGSVRLIVDSLFEVAEGVWWPKHFSLLRFEGDSREVDLAAATHSLSVDVLDARINQEREQDFVYEPAPGGYEAGERRGQQGRQVVAGGFDLLEEAGDRLHEQKKSRSKAGPWMAWILGGSLAIGFWWLQGRKRGVATSSRTGCG